MKRMFALALCLLFTLCSGCVQSVKSVSVTGFYFDTVISITAYCEERVLQNALASCAQYEKRFSKTISGSDVYRVNHAGGKSVRVGADMLAILETAALVSGASGGAFDISIEPAAALWDFKSETPSLPDKGALQKAAALCDYTKIRVEGENVTLLEEGMQLDLGGIAKGYISGKIADELRKEGVESALLNFGGNIVVIGSKPNGEAWRIGIKDPADPHGEPLGVLEREGGAVITSGTYERCFTLNGKRYHHILDTKTGMSVENGVAQFTVVHDDPSLADALSTAALALGQEEGLALCEAFGAQALCVMDNGARFATSGLDLLE